MVAFSKVLTKVFGSRNERLLKRYRRIVDLINEKEPAVQKLSDAGLRARTQEIRVGLKGGSFQTADVLPEVFALIRESMDRNIGIRQVFNPDEHFDPDQFDDLMLQAYDAVQQRMIATGESWRTVEVSPELYAAVRKVYPDSRPPFRARCFDVQLIGGLVLYEGKIAEMATGEGKTFVAPLACFMKVLEGFHTHVVTVNDYLVRRDAQWVTPAFNALGINVGFIQQDMDPGGDNRRQMYGCDITYGTNSEFGFDYLRDNMKERADLQVQGALHFAIVDEVDSILIDEARTPLIISGGAHDDAPKYKRADEVARKVVELHGAYAKQARLVDAAKRAIKAAEGDEDKAKTKEDKEAARARGAEAAKRLEAAEADLKNFTQYFEVELDRKSVHLTHEGIAAAQEEAGVGSFYVGNNMEWPHLMEQSLRAHVVYERDKDYVVERNPRTNEMEVVIVDEYTGRKMVGRQWSDGLHQAVEAKERVTIKQETQTLATITLQNFFKLYKSLSGMTGTAQTEAEEFSKIYKLDIVTIPTNRPVVRADSEDRVYRSEAEKWDAIIEEIKEEASKGRPILVGTTSVEKSERLSNMLMRKHGIEHEVLNAKQHEREANIVAVAGQQHQNAHGETIGNVTIATNMAGRGTDIKLSKESHASGGLHVIGTERHTARRIDNQLRGRGGRQGDPGSSRFYVSLQDDLMKMFAGEWTIKVLGFLGMEEGMAIEDKRISKGILRAQKKVEERNFLARKNLLEYDEVMDHQRSTFYGMRQRVLEGRDVAGVIWEMIGAATEDAVDKYVTQDYVAATVAEWARVNFGVPIDPDDIRGVRRFEDLDEYMRNRAQVEVETNLGSTLQEFMGEDPEDSSHWDIRSLQSWAKSQFGLELSTQQLKQMSPDEVEDAVKAAAADQIAKRDTSGILKYLEPNYALNELSGWAEAKFDVKIDPSEFLADAARGLARSAEEIIALIEAKARQAYTQREMEYPIDHQLGFAFGQDAESADDPYRADYIRNWTMAKFGVEIPLEEIRAMPVARLRHVLIGHQERFLEDGELDKQIDTLLNANLEPKLLVEAFNARFGLGNVRQLTVAELEAAPDKRVLLVPRGRAFFRQELTDLEQFVLIQIFDQTWKDHLYAMDMLKSGIGLQAFAEKDPRILYKKEGYRYFEEMLSGIRDKVTDLIFKARVVGQTEARNNYKETAAVHETSQAYGVTESLRETGGAPVTTTGGEEAQAGGEPVRVKTIVRDQPKVGRNDPCPCDSGRKYKKCCGADVA